MEGEKGRNGRDVGELVVGYDVSRVYREFVPTCSRWQFSSNRLDYAPHHSVFILKLSHANRDSRSARLNPRLFDLTSPASISLIVKEARGRGVSLSARYDDQRSF